jgi:hypothetical protein
LTVLAEGAGFEPSVPREETTLTTLPGLTATAFHFRRKGPTRNQLQRNRPPLYDRFTEGYKAADLRAATALIDDLR